MYPSNAANIISDAIYCVSAKIRVLMENNYIVDSLGMNKFGLSFQNRKYPCTGCRRFTKGWPLNDTEVECKLILGLQLPW